MGWAKTQLLRQMEEGWSSVGEKYVCAKCFDDYAIREFIVDGAVSKKCNYCRRKSKNPIAAEMDEVLSFIAEGIHREYESPVENVPWESAEGGWQLFTPEDGYDLVRDLGFGACPKQLLDDITSAFLDTQWVQKDPFSLLPSEALRFTWESFCEQIKHHTRFVFYRTNSGRGSMEELGHAEPYEILETIGNLVTEFGMITALNAGTHIVRARQHKAREKLTTAEELGPPPREFARQSRMSPAGIPMFHGADSEKTAFVETVNLKAKNMRAVTFAIFRTTRSLRLLDLTSLPTIPSLFDEGRSNDRMSLIFLHGFRRDTANPVVRNGAEHYEYVPTQVVAEYFRHVFRLDGETPVDGIKFESTRHLGGVCYSLFFTVEDCTNTRGKKDKALFLQRVRRCRIDFKSGTFK